MSLFLLFFWENILTAEFGMISDSAETACRDIETKTAKFLMRTFLCRSTFLPFSMVYSRTQERQHVWPKFQNIRFVNISWLEKTCASSTFCNLLFINHGIKKPPREAALNIRLNLWKAMATCIILIYVFNLQYSALPSWSIYVLPLLFNGITNN